MIDECGNEFARPPTNHGESKNTPHLFSEFAGLVGCVNGCPRKANGEGGTMRRATRRATAIIEQQVNRTLRGLPFTNTCVRRVYILLLACGHKRRRKWVNNHVGVT